MATVPPLQTASPAALTDADPARDELSDRAFLEAAGADLLVRRHAEVAELVRAAAWAARAGHPRDERDPMTTPGGDGTPSVREYAIPELAMARETHPATTRALMADALDLQHRLPRTRAVVVAGECEPRVARKVAVISRGLLADVVGIVDRAVAWAIAGHSPSTVFEIARAKVIEADPETHAGERERSRHQRYVSLSRSDEFGYMCIITRTTAGDAVMIDAVVDRVADILALTHGHDHNRDELRSMAMGWLARPVDLLKLLLDHTETDADPNSESDEQPAWAPDHMRDTVERLCSLTSKKLATIRGRGQLFVHLSDAALRSGRGVARIEGVGPIDVAQLHEVPGHCDVTVTPVLDLSDRPRADAYEHPEVMKDHVWALTGGDVFPLSPRTATRSGVDFDHTSPYDPTGPPGQTGPHNSGPLRRRHHRWKTRGGYNCRVAGPGRHLWQTPNNLTYLVDASGTRRLSDDDAEIMLTAPEGVEIYLSDVELSVED
ncbi:DUF222 domain-containing protein [Nocardioides sp. B-3]|uniref:DUF222 domain-containing protein n=1 Tax=Nocardioides sp. B-3 TaxID=2895565 RepID=UPI002152320A|nr:hypothetical protein [Nocardioides sp. B-3]UUZ59439.1 hypothetical protein LP418_27225 [Nocardioides sp. B-3]